jgi:hypothetical protein
MSLFQKKVTPIQNITFMAMMAAINIVFVLITTFVPVLVVALLFILPFTSVLVTLFCQKRYYPLYIIATIGLCIVVTIWNFSDTLFYVIPSMISGFVFGFLAKYKFPLLYLILGPAVIQFAFSYLAIPLIELIYGFNIIDTFANAFNLGGFAYLYLVVPSFIFLISFIQAIISYMIIRDELIKFNSPLFENKDFFWVNVVINLTLLILIIILAFFNLPIAYLCLIISLVITTYFVVLSIDSKNIFSVISTAINILVTVVLFAVFYPLVNKEASFLLIGIFFLLETLKTLIIKLVFNGREKTIN